MGCYPGGQVLRPGRFSVGVLAGPQNAEEDLRIVNLTRLRIYHGHSVASIIDKTLLPELVLLAHHQIAPS